MCIRIGILEEDGDHGSHGCTQHGLAPATQLKTELGWGEAVHVLSAAVHVLVHGSVYGYAYEYVYGR